MNILIAEDDPVSSRILETTLMGWGHEVLVATDGKIAWEVLQREDSPRFAILDIMMPGMDGGEICRRVREVSPSIPPYILLLTAMNRKDDLVRGIRSGANDYLTKPFHREELKVRVEAGVEMLELQRALADRVKELENTLIQVNQLQGLLPICSYCNKVRDDKNYWERVETYFSDRIDIQFSHGICPACLDRVKSEVKIKKQQGLEVSVINSDI